MVHRVSLKWCQWLTWRVWCLVPTFVWNDGLIDAISRQIPHGHIIVQNVRPDLSHIHQDLTLYKSIISCPVKNIIKAKASSIWLSQYRNWRCWKRQRIWLSSFEIRNVNMIVREVLVCFYVIRTGYYHYFCGCGEDKEVMTTTKTYFSQWQHNFHEQNM